MERRLLSVLVGVLLASALLAQEAYRWTDDEGVVHYSDTPREGAERVDLAGFSRTTGARIGPAPNAADNSGPDTTEESPFGYESLEVSSPGAEETLWNIEGVLNVSLALQPGLQPGHQVRVYFDGTPQLVAGTSFQIEEVYRGVHNIQAEVIDETGQLMIRSQPNRFYVQQNSIVRRPGGR